MASQTLAERLEALGRSLGQREAEHREALDRARARAESLRELVRRALEGFHTAVAGSGAPELHIELSPVRTDDKHLRAFEFDVERGRTRAVVVVKSRGDVTLVGPFHRGKNEGPCRSFPQDADAEIEGALGDLLERFLEEAAAP